MSEDVALKDLSLSMASSLASPIAVSRGDAGSERSLGSLALVASS